MAVNNIALKISLLYLMMTLPCMGFAQKVIPIIDSTVTAYTFGKGRIQRVSVGSLTNAKRSSEDVLYVLDKLFGNKNYRIQNELKVSNHLLKAHIANEKNMIVDSLEAALYFIQLKQPLGSKAFNKISANYMSVNLPASIMPLTNYLVALDSRHLGLFSFLSGLFTQEESLNQKKQNITAVLAWISNKCQTENK